MTRYVTEQEVAAAVKRIAVHVKGTVGYDDVRCIYGVPRGGIPVADLLCRELRLDYVASSLGGLDPKTVLVVDDIIDSGATRQRFAEYPFVSLFGRPGISGTSWRDTPPTYCAEETEEWLSFPWERKNGEATGVEDNVRRLLQFVGEDVNRDGLKETPARVAKALGELCEGYSVDPASLMTVFEDSCDEMVVLRDIEFFSMCEHHMLPFFGRAHVAYIPDGRVIGISKLARLVDVFARRLQIQERIGEQVTDALMHHLKPAGAACVIEAKHLCMVARGVGKQNSVMVTSSLRGAFRQDLSARRELFSLIGVRNGG